MAVLMSSMTSEIHTHGRMDPEYYLPHHTQTEAELDLVPTTALGKLGHFSCSAFYPAATHLYTSNGIPFLRCVDIVTYPLISPDQPFARIPAGFATAHATVRHLSPGDIVISKVGSPCYASLLADEMPISAMTRTVLGMSDIDSNAVDPFYLIAFLRSRHGFDQLLRERELTIQYQLTLERTRKIRVFIPEDSVQKQIGDLIRLYYKKIRYGVDAYINAERLLEENLGIVGKKSKNDAKASVRFSNVCLSDTFDAGRIDAQCFAPDALFYEERLQQSVPCDRLGTLLRARIKGRQQSEQSEGAVPFCSIKNITDREIKDAISCNPDLETPLARRDDLILAITGATIGKVGIVKQYSRIAFSGDMLCLRPNSKVDPHYLLLALSHQSGQVQFGRWTTGSTNGHLSPRDVARVIVPRLQTNVEQEIAELVERSLEARREAEALLVRAQTDVARAISDHGQGRLHS